MWYVVSQKIRCVISYFEIKTKIYQNCFRNPTCILNIINIFLFYIKTSWCWVHMHFKFDVWIQGARWCEVCSIYGSGVHNVLVQGAQVKVHSGIFWVVLHNSCHTEFLSIVLYWRWLICSLFLRCCYVGAVFIFFCCWFKFFCQFLFLYKVVID